jgi:ribosome recycling factor
MLEDLKADAKERMAKSLESLGHAFNKIRTGRAHPSLLDSITLSYYGVETPLNQLANINVSDARTLVVVPWEKKMISEVEKAIMKSGLGLNPSTSGDIIRLPMPALTEETRKVLIKQAKGEAEHARVSVRNIRRDVLSDVKDLLKAKDITEDEERKAQDDVQKITDSFIAKIDAQLADKETDLMAI